MDRSTHAESCRIFRRNPRMILAICFISGLTFGAAFSVSADSMAQLIPAALSAPGSLTGLLSAALLPFLLSALVVFMGRPLFLLPIAFCKAFLAGFLGCSILQFYGSAGLLVRGLLLFSECVTLPALYYYWYRHLSPKHRSVPLTTAASVCVAVLAGTIDYCFVSPFLTAVIS